MYPGAAECIARLAARWPLGIASGAARNEIEMMLRGRSLDRYFRFIVAAGETPEGKPAPDPYLKAALLHGQAPVECVAIEDSRWGIESAKAAGLHCVGITHTYPVNELLTADAIVIVACRADAGVDREDRVSRRFGARGFGPDGCGAATDDCDCDCRLRLPTADCRLPTADCRLPTADCRLPTADCRLPTDIQSRQCLSPSTSSRARFKLPRNWNWP